MAAVSQPVDFSQSIDHSVVKGKTALITGGASGIGAGTVRALAEAGAIVTIADLNVAAGEQHAATLRAEGHQVSFIQTDVTSWPSQVAAFKHALTTSPSNQINIVIACAGVAGGSLLQDTPFTPLSTTSDPEPPDAQLSILNINLTGSIYTATLATHYFLQQKSPSPSNTLILIASNIAYYSAPGYTGYCASKWGVRGFWKSLKATPELAKVMRTNLLAPHIVRSPMTAGLQPLLDAKGVALTEVQDCVDCLVRFCCDEGIRGRAVEVNPLGSKFDLKDDLDDYDGAKMFKEHFEETKPVFDFMMNPNLSME